MFILSLGPWLLGCTELVDGATRQVFIDTALELDRVPEGEPRDRALAMTDAGWLNAGEVGIGPATRFASELDRMLVDDALSDDEIARLDEMTKLYGTERLEGRQSELMAKRQAVAEARKIRTAHLGVRLDGADVWPAPGPMEERGEAVGWAPLTCHRQRESGYQLDTCGFADADDVVKVTFTIFSERGDARLAARAAPWERGAVALRRGRRVLKVRSTDRAEAQRVLSGLEALPTESSLPLSAFQAALVALGYQLDACRIDRTLDGQRLYCDLSGEDRGGFAVLEERVSGTPSARTLTYEGGEARLDLGVLRLRARVHTAAASAARLARFRGLPEADADARSDDL